MIIGEARGHDAEVTGDLYRQLIHGFADSTAVTVTFQRIEEIFRDANNFCLWRRQKSGRRNFVSLHLSGSDLQPTNLGSNRKSGIARQEQGKALAEH